MDSIIRETISQFSASYPYSRNTGWKNQLVAYASAEDPLFKQLINLVSSTHWLPFNFLEEAKTVITYFIPFKETVIKSNRESRYSSSDWAVSYIVLQRNIALRRTQNKFLKRFLAVRTVGDHITLQIIQDIV